jgi:hypothetical protein
MRRFSNSDVFENLDHCLSVESQISQADPFIVSVDPHQIFLGQSERAEVVRDNSFLPQERFTSPAR